MRPWVSRRAVDKIVAQVSKPAVSPISQSAGCSKNQRPQSFPASAGLETRDTAGFETCPTLESAEFFNGPGDLRQHGGRFSLSHQMGGAGGEACFSVCAADRMVR